MSEEKLPIVAIVNERIEEGHTRAKMLDKGDSVCKVGDKLVRRKDHLEDKMMTLRFALEAFDRGRREAIRQRLDKLKASVEKKSAEGGTK